MSDVGRAHRGTVDIAGAFALAPGAADFDNHRRFVLDNPHFSSIIYIWYEGGRLRPLVVNNS